MRLIGLLSVDIDLETVDVNQCDAAPTEPASTKPSFSPPPPIKAAQPANGYALNQLNSQQNFDANANQPAVSERLIAGGTIDEQATGEPNTVEPSDWLSQLTVRAKEFKESNYLSSNESQRFLSQPIASSQSAFTANNHSTSDESYRMSGSSTRLTNRIMLHFEKTNKCHRESSQVSLFFLVDFFGSFWGALWFLWEAFLEVSIFRGFNSWRFL